MRGQPNPHSFYGLDELAPRAPDTTIVHPICALNPRGMTKQGCIDATTLPQRNHHYCCGNSQYAPCKSKDRLCKECVLHPGPKGHVVDPQVGLCDFHSEVKNRHKPQPREATYQRKPPPLAIPTKPKAAPPAPKSHEPRPVSPGLRLAALKETLRPKLPESVRKMLDDDRISVEVAKRLLKNHPDSQVEQEYIAHQYLRKEISFHDI